MLKVWIAGAEGQIGTAINEILDPLGMETFNTDRAELEAMLNELKAVADAADSAQVPSETEKEMECGTAPEPADSPNES